MNLAGLFRVVDALVAFRDVAKRFTNSSQTQPEPTETPASTQVSASTQAQGPGGQIEARLTNVVVAALKEAFDRDHARLELERAHLEEERRRAEAALQAELRRQAADRELARLRLLAGAAMVGWIASVATVAGGLASGTDAARGLLAFGWLLLLGALGAAFTAQGRVAAAPPGGSRGDYAAGFGVAALWLLIAGLAATAVSLLV